MAETTRRKHGGSRAGDPIPPSTPQPKALKNSRELCTGEQLTAAVATNAGMNAAGVIESFGKPAFGHMDGGLNPTALWNAISEKAALIHSGDMHDVESMLYGQSLALQSMFMSLSRRACNQEFLPQYEAYMRLALKAQSQCRTTLEALFEMKNPRPVAFVQQANIANGPQQVNNGSNAVPTSTRGSAHAHGIFQSTTNELLAVSHEEGQRLDTGAARETAKGDPAMATVASVQRAQKRRR